MLGQLIAIVKNLIIDIKSVLGYKNKNQIVRLK